MTVDVLLEAWREHLERGLARRLEVVATDSPDELVALDCARAAPAALD